MMGSEKGPTAQRHMQIVRISALAPEAQEQRKCIVMTKLSGCLITAGLVAIMAGILACRTMGDGSDPGAMSMAPEARAVVAHFWNETTRELAAAAGRSDTEGVARLIREGADPNQQGEDGVTPLAWAVRSASLSGTRALLDQGADPNVASDSGDTVLHLAALRCGPVLIRTLVEGGADVRRPGAGARTPLMSAALSGNVESVRVLLELGGDVSRRDKAENTALHYAACGDVAEIVSLLLSSGGDRLATNSTGLSPLALGRVVREGSPMSEALQSLLAITAEDIFQDPPTSRMVASAWRGDAEGVRRESLRGADGLTENRAGWTPLGWALEKDNLMGFKLLMSEGLSSQSSAASMRVFLVRTAARSDSRYLRAALAHVDRFSISSTDLGHVLLSAVTAEREDCVRMLVDAGADTETPDRDGLSPLHHAVLLAHTPMVRTLLEHGASADASDRSGRTPRHLAALLRRPEILAGH
ncbi:MAG: ankyrin repeat protein [Myxococcota bacterium]|jgi:ankyrin repeat protein